jgi:putative SOS response-associated peptidase YedK
MCGRFVLAVDPDALQDEFPEFIFPEDIPVRYNIAPSLDIAAVPNDGELAVRMFKWGLIPYWAKDPKIGSRMINARSETLAEKLSFREAFKKRRCLILANGFYEWRKDPGGQTKTPMYISMKSGETFGFAGLWETWKQPDGKPLNTCTIITTEPNELMEQIHNRMPVILSGDHFETWLDPDIRESADLSDILDPYPASEMTAHPVSKLVNYPRNDNQACISPVEETSSDQETRL